MTRQPQILSILQVHTLYRQAGGEDQVVEAERRLLHEAGLGVSQVIFDNSGLPAGSPLGDLRAAATALWSRTAYHRVLHAIDTHRPQVVHVHNTFAAASPSVYAAARARKVPVVQTLHNYRFVCPSATAFRDGHTCTDCVGRSVGWPGVVHACVRGSRAQSAVAATTLAVHRAIGTFDRGITRYVALTPFQRSLMVRGGIDADRIRVIPNFLEPDPGQTTDDRSGFVFVGRLTVEKGIRPLLAAARSVRGMVRLAGTGPLLPMVEEAMESGEVRYLGALERSGVIHQLQRSTAMVIPSVWFEGFPLTVVEAFATATPVIASAIGSLGEIIEDGVTGLLARPGDADDLADRLRWAWENPDRLRAMGLAARQRYERLYRGDRHLAALEFLYRELADVSSPLPGA